MSLIGKPWEPNLNIATFKKSVKVKFEDKNMINEKKTLQ